jgi:hypothetical protein
MRALAALLVALVAAGGLVVWYDAAGGDEYKPLELRDPCDKRAWRSPEGFDAIAQQVALSALDGAACDLGVARETLALALTSDSGRERFMREQKITEKRLEEALRVGLRRAVVDARREGAINELTGFLIERAIDMVPTDKLLEAINDRSLSPLLPGG